MVRTKVPRTIAVVALVLGIIAPAGANAGTFVVQTLYYTIWDYENYQLFWVKGMAKYVGSVDPEDDFWAFQTAGNHQLGGNLNDWTNPDFTGVGKNGANPYTNMKIWLTDGKAANGEATRTICGHGTNNQARGRGTAIISHPFNPEINPVDGYIHTVECYEPPACEGPTAVREDVIDVDTGEVLASRELTTEKGSMGWRREGWYGFDEYAGVDFVDGGIPGVSVSTGRFSDNYQLAIDASLAARDGDEGAHTLLVIRVPRHVRNTRHIQPPSLGISPDLRTDLSPGEEGVSYERIEFNPDGTLYSLDTLHRSTDGLTYDFYQDLKEAVSVRFQGSKSHRTVFYVRLGLSDVVSATVVDVVLPLCCCGGTWCI